MVVKGQEGDGSLPCHVGAFLLYLQYLSFEAVIYS